MNIKDKAVKLKKPIKVMQFGEGNFLRAFVDYMIDIANEKGAFGGSIAIVKPISFGNLDAFREQDNLYTVVLRGKENGKVVNDSRIITSVSKILPRLLVCRWAQHRRSIRFPRTANSLPPLT